MSNTKFFLFVFLPMVAISLWLYHGPAQCWSSWAPTKELAVAYIVLCIYGLFAFLQLAHLRKRFKQTANEDF